MSLALFSRRTTLALQCMDLGLKGTRFTEILEAAQEECLLSPTLMEMLA